MKKKNTTSIDFANAAIYTKIVTDYTSRVAGAVGSRGKIDEVIDYFKSIACVHEFVSFITSAESEIDENGYLGLSRSTNLTQRKLAKFHDHFFIYRDDRRFNETYRYSEQVELFWDQIDHVSSDDSYRNNDCSLDLFNEVVKRIVDVAKGADYKKRVDSRHKSVAHNVESVSQHVSSLFKIYQELHVVRIDLLPSMVVYPKLIEADEAHRLLKQFLKDNHRKALFRNVAGYIWKLEHSPLKGAYFHFVLLLEKSDLLLTDFIADKFGKFWVESVTGNQGTYLVCQENLDLYRSTGAGVIQQHEHKAIQLLGSLKYLLMKDFYLLPKCFLNDGKRKNRTLGRSQL